MKQKALTLGAGILGIALAAGVTTAYAQTAAEGETSTTKEDFKAERQAKHEEMQQILESGDYDAWVANIEEKQTEMNERFDEMKTQDSFEQAQELKELRETDPEAFRAKIQEMRENGEKPFGLHGPGKMMRGGQGHGFEPVQ